MSGGKDNSGVIGAIVVIAIIVGFIVFSGVNSNKNSTSSDDTNTKPNMSTYETYKTYTPTNTKTAEQMISDAEQMRSDLEKTVNQYKTYELPTNVTTTTTTTNENWHCVDVTSYNRNAYDDNKCTKGSEVRYVSDSQAIGLDPSYSPGKSGAYYYNNK